MFFPVKSAFLVAPLQVLSTSHFAVAPPSVHIFPSKTGYFILSCQPMSKKAKKTAGVPPPFKEPEACAFPALASITCFYFLVYSKADFLVIHLCCGTMH